MQPSSPKRRRVSSSTKTPASDSAAVASPVEIICIDSDDDDVSVVIACDTEDVTVVPVEPTPGIAVPEPTELLSGSGEDDEDLVASAVLRIADVYPHARADCREKPFSEGKTNAAHDVNLQICDKCYCYVCDVEAAKCPDWPMHCMASDKKGAWRTLRETKRRRKTRLVPVPPLLLPPRLRAHGNRAVVDSNASAQSTSGIVGKCGTPGRTALSANVTPFAGSAPQAQAGNPENRRATFMERVRCLGRQRAAVGGGKRSPRESIPCLGKVHALVRDEMLMENRAYLTSSNPDAYLVGKIDFYRPTCAHRQASIPVNSLNAPGNGFPFRVDTQPGNKSAGRILAREVGIPYEDRWYECRRQSLHEFNELLSFLITEEQELVQALARRDCFSAVPLFSKHKLAISAEVVRCFSRLVESSHLQVRWELSHHDGFESTNSSHALSTLHCGLAPPFVDLADFKLTAKDTCEWIDSCWKRCEDFAEFNESNCCRLRAWVYLLPKVFSSNNVFVASLTSQSGTPSSFRPCLDAPLHCVQQPRGVSCDGLPMWNVVYDLGRVMSLIDFADFTICRPSLSPSRFLPKSYDSPLMSPLLRGSLEVDSAVFESHECLYESPESVVAGSRIQSVFSVEGILTSPLFTVSEGYLLPRASQPRDITVDLRPYQLETLQWMLDQECRQSISEPFWVKLTMIACSGVQPRAVQQGALSWMPFWYSPLTGNVSRDPPPKVCGGILSEEMGLGKTVEVISLIVETLKDSRAQPLVGRGTKESPLCIGATLVLTPVSLLYQWHEELLRRTRAGSLRVCLWYGTQRPNTPAALAQYDVILTTYSTMASRSSSACLESLHFYRVVLDESTYVKDGNVACLYRSVLQIKAKRRWAVSGTPFANNLKAILPILRFLGVSPFAAEKATLPVVDAFNLRLAGNRRHRVRAYDAYKYSVLPGWPIAILAYLLKSLVMRHVRIQMFDGRPLLQLPSWSGRLVFVDLSPEERTAYDATEVDARRASSAMLSSEHVVKSNIIALHANLMPVRMAACGIVRKLEHTWEADGKQKRAYATRMTGTVAKAKQVVRDIRAILTDDGAAKFVVFTEHYLLRSRVEGELAAARVGVCTIVGSMSACHRGRILKKFSVSRAHAVLILSSKFAHGLSLTCANVIMLLEPSLSQETELQACDRVRRIGQTRVTQILTYAARNTVDERILQVRRMKGQSAAMGEPPPSGGNEQLSHRVSFCTLFNFPL